MATGTPLTPKRATTWTRAELQPTALCGGDPQTGKPCSWRTGPGIFPRSYREIKSAATHHSERTGHTTFVDQLTRTAIASIDPRDDGPDAAGK